MSSERDSFKNKIIRYAIPFFLLGFGGKAILESGNDLKDVPFEPHSQITDKGGIYFVSEDTLILVGQGKNFIPNDDDDAARKMLEKLQKQGCEFITNQTLDNDEKIYLVRVKNPDCLD